MRCRSVQGLNVVLYHPRPALVRSRRHRCHATFSRHPREPADHFLGDRRKLSAAPRSTAWLCDKLIIAKEEGSNRREMFAANNLASIETLFRKERMRVAHELSLFQYAGKTNGLRAWRWLDNLQRESCRSGLDSIGGDSQHAFLQAKR